MRLSDLGPLPLTVLASLVVAVVLLAIRVFIMGRVQTKRQRENRQESERLKSLVAAYRSLAGSFSPAGDEHTPIIEESLSDIVLFGSLAQVELAVECVNAMKRGDVVDYQPLVEEIRSDLRRQLGLDPIAGHINVPRSGPGRTLPRGGRGGGDGGGDGQRGEGRGGGGFGGGAAAGAGGGVGLGLLASDALERKE